MRFASHALLLFTDGTWLLDTTRAALTPANLARLFDTPYDEYVNSRGETSRCCRDAPRPRLTIRSAARLTCRLFLPVPDGQPDRRV